MSFRDSDNRVPPAYDPWDSGGAAIETPFSVRLRRQESEGRDPGCEETDDPHSAGPARVGENRDPDAGDYRDSCEPAKGVTSSTLGDLRASRCGRPSRYAAVEAAEQEQPEKQNEGWNKHDCPGGGGNDYRYQR